MCAAHMVPYDELTQQEVVMKTLKFISALPMGLIAASLFGFMLVGVASAGVGPSGCVDAPGMPCSPPPSPPSRSPSPVYTPQAPTPRAPSPQEIERQRRQEASNYNVLGNEEFKRGYYDKAIQYYLKALEYSPNNQVIRNNLRSARKHKERIEKMLSTNARGLDYYNQNNWQFAIDYFQRALMHAESRENREIIEKNLKNAKMALSFERRQQEEQEQRRSWKREIDSSKTGMDAIFNDSLADAPAGLEYMEPGLVSGTTDASKEDALEKQADVLWKLNDLQGAENIYRSLIVQYKDNPPKKAIAMLRLARILHEKGDDDAAIKMLNEATTIASGDPQVDGLVQLLYAESLYEHGDLKGSINALKKYTLMHPDNKAAARQLTELENINITKGTGSVPEFQSPGMVTPEFGRGDDVLPGGFVKGRIEARKYHYRGMQHPTLPANILQHQNFEKVSSQPKFKAIYKRRTELARERETIRAKLRDTIIQLDKEEGNQEELEEIAQQYQVLFDNNVRSLLESVEQ